jgi:TAZ zinc finger
MDTSTLPQRLRPLVESIRVTKKPSSSSRKKKPAMAAPDESDRMTTELVEWQNRQQHQLCKPQQQPFAESDAPHCQSPLPQGENGCPLSDADPPMQAQPAHAPTPTNDAPTAPRPVPDVVLSFCELKMQGQHLLCTTSPPLPSPTNLSIAGARTASRCQVDPRATMIRTQDVASLAPVDALSPAEGNTPRAAILPSPEERQENSPEIHTDASTQGFLTTCSPLTSVMASSGMESSNHYQSNWKQPAATPQKRPPKNQAKHPPYAAMPFADMTSMDERQDQSHRKHVSFAVTSRESCGTRTPTEEYFHHPYECHRDERRIQLERQRLVLLYHATSCQHGEVNDITDADAPGCTSYKCPATPHCATMKRVWKHVQTCQDRNCRAPHCLSTRRALDHFRQCRDDVYCVTCAPVRYRIRNDQQRLRQHEGHQKEISHNELTPSSTNTVVSHFHSVAPPNEQRGREQQQAFPVSRGTPQSFIKVKGPQNKNGPFPCSTATVATNLSPIRQGSPRAIKKLRLTSVSRMSSAFSPSLRNDSFHSLVTPSMSADVSPPVKEALLLERCKQLEEDRDRAIQKMQAAERFALELSKKYETGFGNVHADDCPSAAAEKSKE